MTTTWTNKQTTQSTTTLKIVSRAADTALVAIDTHRDSDSVRLGHDHIIIPTATLKEMVLGLDDNPNLINALLKACINCMTPAQTAGILEEMPELRERGFPEDYSTHEMLWSYTEV